MDDSTMDLLNYEMHGWLAFFFGFFFGRGGGVGESGLIPFDRF